MDIAINIKYYSRYMGMEKAAKCISDAGFTHLDYTPPVQDDNWEDVMKESAKIFLCAYLLIFDLFRNIGTDSRLFFLFAFGLF